MITAKIQFLQNSLIADLSRLPIYLYRDLRAMGVLTPQDMIRLDNARTLKIELYPEDNYGKRLLDLVDKKTDTLGAVAQLCHTIKCMDNRDKEKFFENLDEGKYSSLSDAQHDAYVLDGQREMRRKKKKDDRER